MDFLRVDSTRNNSARELNVPMDGMLQVLSERSGLACQQCLSRCAVCR